MFSVLVPSTPCEALLAYIHAYSGDVMKFQSGGIIPTALFMHMN